MSARFALSTSLGNRTTDAAPGLSYDTKGTHPLLLCHNKAVAPCVNVTLITHDLAFINILVCPCHSTLSQKCLCWIERDVSFKFEQIFLLHPLLPIAILNVLLP